MKSAKKILMIYLVLLLMAVFTFTGCSGDSPPPVAENQTKASKPDEEEEEEEDEKKENASEKNEAGTEAYEHWQNNKGIGPVKKIELGETIDQTMADAGAKIYKEKCTSCHKPDKRFIGPSPKGVFERRTPEWVMNMILNPEKMVKEDPIAKQLLMDYNLSPMANQNLTEDEARKVLEYFRTL